MVDPFSIVGAIGTTAGLLSLVVSTIENAARKYSALRECQWRLLGHYTSLLALSLKLKQWQRRYQSYLQMINAGRWDFAALWSSSGWMKIQGILMCIEKEDETVRKILFGNSQPSKELAWISFLEGPNIKPDERALLMQATPITERETGSISHPSASRRTRFALFNSALVEDSISRLRTQIDNLGTCSPELLDEHLGLHEDGRNREDALALKYRAQKLWAAMADAYERLRDPARSWALLMPAMEDPSHLTVPDRMELHFLYTEGPPQKHARSRRVSAMYEHDDYSTESYDVASAIKVCVQAPQSPNQRGALHSDFRTYFRHCVYKEPEALRQRQTATSLDRAEAALYVATWASLAWGSRWVDCFCNCGLRRAEFRDGKIVMFYVDRSHVGCYGLDLGQRPHLLLGLVLAEIALGQPVTFQQEDSMFIVQEAAQTFVPVDRAALLKLVGKQMPGNFFTSAVLQCLRWDERDDRSEFRPEDIWRYKQQVVAPLHRYFHEVAGPRQADHPRVYQACRENEREDSVPYQLLGQHIQTVPQDARRLVSE